MCKIIDDRRGSLGEGATSLGILIVFGVLIVFSALFLFNFQRSFVYDPAPPEVTYYSLYYAEAPFGILATNLRGGFFWTVGSIGSELKEIYVVKYWDENDQLMSLTLPAKDTPIVVDGSFRLEKNVTLSGFVRPTTYRIHLPNLPDNLPTPTGYGGNS